MTATSTGRTLATLGVALLAAVISLLIAPALSQAGKIPATNVVQNPTFNQGAKGWSGHNSRLATIRHRGAPDGKKVARVGQRIADEPYTIDDHLTSAGPTIAGSGYGGRAYVRGTSSSAGRKAELVLRETTPSGDFVGESTKSIKLDDDRFRKIQVKRAATVEGNSIDVYVRMAAGKTRSSFLVDAISLTAPRQPGAPGGGGGAVSTSQMAIVSDYESSLFEADGSRYRYIIVRDTIEGRLEELRAAHPESEILLYKDVGFTFDDGCKWAPLQGAGVDFCEADPNESWFLHRKSNPQQRISSNSFEGYRAMNLSNPGYQRAWLDSVLERLKDAHADGSGARYDGVWMDDTNLFPGHGMDGQIAELSDSAYRSATVSFVDAVAPRLEAAGFKTIPNLALQPWDDAQRAAAVQVAADVTAINREGFVRWGDSGTLFTTDGDEPLWEDEVTLAEQTQAAGADLHAVTYGGAGDVRTQRFARATFLMAWDGSDGGAINYRTNEAAGSWGPGWTTDVGVPAGERRSVGQGWLRRFSNGTVAINPGTTGTQQFSLGGTYRGPDGGCVSTIELGPTRAAVMQPC